MNAENLDDAAGKLWRHIHSVAERNIRKAYFLKALADGLSVLGPLKWEKEKDDKPPPFGYTPAIVPSDTPPLGRAANSKNSLENRKGS